MSKLYIFFSKVWYCRIYFRSNSSGSSVNSPSALGSSNMANPYAMGPLYHSPGVQSYCGPTDNLSLAGHYTDMRSSGAWYGSTASDPRFASECKHVFFVLLLFLYVIIRVSLVWFDSLNDNWNLIKIFHPRTRVITINALIKIHFFLNKHVINGYINEANWLHKTIQ